MTHGVAGRIFLLTVFLCVLMNFQVGFSKSIECYCNNEDEDDDCVNNTCTIESERGHCEVEVHYLNKTNQIPVEVKQHCLLSETLFPTVCTTSSLDKYSDGTGFEVCCFEVHDPPCNKCPSQLILEAIDEQYIDVLYDLFPADCRPTTNVSSSIAFDVSSSSTLSIMTLSTYSATRSSADTPTVTTPPTTQDNDRTDDSDDTYLYLFLVMAGLGLFVILAVITAIILIVHCIVRGKRRKVRETPYCTNNTFGDFDENMTGCSSNALTETRLLQSRTLVDDIKLSKMLGRGRFGSVYLGLYGQEPIAVKIFDSHHESEWLREVDIYSTHMLYHSNILKYISSDKKETGTNYTGDMIHLWTCLEYHPNGNLQEYLKRRRGLPLSEAFTLATTFLEGLHFLHRNIKSGACVKPGIAHRDLKSLNILVKSDLACCIGDLGLAVKQKDDSGVDMVPLNKLSGTRRYLAPEILDQSMNFEKFQCYVYADIYASSLVLWEIFNCVVNNEDISSSNPYQPPFYEHVSHSPSLEDMKRIVISQQLKPSLKHFSSSEELTFLCKILKESWDRNPIVRPSALNICKKLRTARNNFCTEIEKNVN